MNALLISIHASHVRDINQFRVNIQLSTKMKKNIFFSLKDSTRFTIESFLLGDWEFLLFVNSNIQPMVFSFNYFNFN